MNEDIEKLKVKLKKKIENYEIDKKIGQLSVDSIYSMFPTESKMLLDYIEQLQNNWNELKKWLEEDNYKGEEIWVNTQEVLHKIQELEGNNDSKRDV